mmetsp:Transcript_91374/g.263084  ORF Transcript_91374/g.263084 Transcript_91374/m.263084 type:complete len:213 (-) Transcript_91374:1049-1687(-)
MRSSTSLSASSKPPANLRRASKSLTAEACRASVASSSCFMSASLISNMRLDSTAKARDCWASDSCTIMSFSCSSIARTRGASALFLSCRSCMFCNRCVINKSSPALTASFSAVALMKRASSRSEAAASSRLASSCAPRRPIFAKCSASVAAPLSSKWRCAAVAELSSSCSRAICSDNMSFVGPVPAALSCRDTSALSSNSLRSPTGSSQALT